MTGVEPGECDQEALFELEGPDEDGCVWILSGVGMDAQTFNLGPRRAVAEKFLSWLAQQDYGERPSDWPTGEGVIEQPGYDEHADPGDFGGPGAESATE